MVDAANGGFLVNETPTQAREPQFRKVNELGLGPFIETRVSQITRMLNKLIIGGVCKGDGM